VGCGVPFSPAQFRLPPSRASTERHTRDDARHTPGQTPARSGRRYIGPDLAARWDDPAGPEAKAHRLHTHSPTPAGDRHDRSSLSPAPAETRGSGEVPSPRAAQSALAPVLVDMMVAVPGVTDAGGIVSPLTPRLHATEEHCVGKQTEEHAQPRTHREDSASVTSLHSCATHARTRTVMTTMPPGPESEAAGVRKTPTRAPRLPVEERPASERSWRRSVAPHVALALQLSPGGQAELSRARATTAGDAIKVI
jgi:hypothetical protein